MTEKGRRRRWWARYTGILAVEADTEEGALLEAVRVFAHLIVIADDRELAEDIVVSEAAEDDEDWEATLE